MKRKLEAALRMLLLCLLVCLLAPASGYAQSLALTFDDGFNPAEQPQAAAWNAAILAALADAHLKSILFAAGKRVASPAGLALVRNWGLAGHEIGNHSWSHWDLSADSITLAAYIADADKDEALLKRMPGWTRRFRFPYLKEGDTAAKRDGFREWLAARGYGSGAVSIDASDWYYSSRYLAWKDAHPGADPAPFRAAYLDHLWSRARYYDGLSQQLFQRSVKHVLLLHTNAINAAFLPDVIAMFRSKGWTLIGPEQAWHDPVYAIKPAVLPAGESILWSLAKQKDIDGLRYPAEDDIYEKPLLDARKL